MSRRLRALPGSARCRTIRLVAATVTLLLLAGCSGAETTPQREATAAAEASASTTTPASSSPAQTPSPSTKPATPTRTPSPKPQLPTRKVDTVTNTRSRSVSGSGPVDLRVARRGNFGLVAQLDCSRCRGRVLITATDRQTPFADAAAPLTNAYLISVLRADPRQQSLLLRVKGHWKVTFRSWNSLPVQQGKQSGRGSQVLYLGDRASRIRVSYRPAGSKDSFDARIFTVSKEPLIFGDDKAFTETEKIHLPGVIAITTNGRWTVTPK